MNRYKELLNICEAMRPKRILEIGVWNGRRAAELCQFGAEYVGFDLFEEANAETDEEEKNVKPHYTKEDVSAFLTEHNVKHELVKGNTRDTLPAYDNGKFDFIFIDGGHSLETIRSDWAEAKRMAEPGAIVVFDDYYEDMKDTHLWGCNEVVKDFDILVLSDSADPVVPTGKVRIAVTMV